MEPPLVTSDHAVPSKVDANALLTKKRQIRALKRVLIAKAEIRRLKSLVGLRRVTAR
jgi:hypothetical protein